jgi:hypothetical protein
MLHPDVELRFINPEVGSGLFARAFIPQGTITYVTDSLDILIAPGSPVLANPIIRALVEKYATLESAHGKYELSWDLGKYMNHCCFSNTLSTGFNFDVAVLDIQPGDEITCDYGQYNVDYAMELSCRFADCRKRVRRADFDKFTAFWDSRIIPALPAVMQVAQPLMPLVDAGGYAALEQYLASGAGYRTAASLHVPLTA